MALRASSKQLRRSSSGAGRRLRVVRTRAKARQSWYPGTEFPEHLDGRYACVCVCV